MLTDSDRELITSAVDEELPPERETVFHALMNSNPTAAALFVILKEDRRRMQDLPRRRAPAGLTAAVADRVARLPRIVPATPRKPLRRAGWVQYAVAASVLLAIGGLSFWVSMIEESDSTVQVAQQKRLPRSPERHATSPAVPTEPARELGPTPRPALPQNSDDENSRLAVRPRPVESTPERAPLPRHSGHGDLVGSRPFPDGTPLQSVAARLPVLAPVTVLDRQDVRDRLRQELVLDPAFRLDIFAKDIPRATAEVQAAAAAVGLAVTVEPSAQDRLRKKVPTVVVLYTDSLTIDEIGRFTDQLAKRARAAEKKSPVFTTAHLIPAQEAEQRDLRDLIGLDVAFGKRARTGAAKGVAAGTASEIAAALDKDNAGKPAILLTYQPVAFRVNPSASKEIKAFRDRLDARKAAGIPLLVVIRPSF